MTTTIEGLEVGPLISRIVRHKGLVYLCAQIAASGVGDVTERTRECSARVDRLLTQAETYKTRIVSALIHLGSMSDFESMNKVREGWIPAAAEPARTEARSVAAELLVVISVVASPRGSVVSPAGAL